MRTALLVIDVQRKYLDDAPRPADADATLGRINRLSARAREAGSTVIFVQHEHPVDNPHGSIGWELEPTLHVHPGDIIASKTTPDAFLGTTLGELLDERGIRRLVVCGYASEHCVDTSVRRAAALGYDVVLASDAHTTHDKAHASGAEIRVHHNATLPELTSFAGKIRALPVEEIAFGE